MLQNVIVKDGAPGSDTEFYRHSFTYTKIQRDPNDHLIHFGTAQQWGTMPDGQSLSNANGNGAHASGFIGFGIGTPYPHLGVGYWCAVSGDTTTNRIADVNGDGLPDFMNVNGTALLNTLDRPGRMTGTFTSAPISYGGTLSGFIGQSWNTNSAKMIGFHFQNENGASGSLVDGHAFQDRGISDINGDGKPDIFFGQSAMLNTSTGNTISFGAPVSWSGVDGGNFPMEAGGSSTGGGGIDFKSAPFARWTAPYEGYVTLTAIHSDRSSRIPIQTTPRTLIR